MATPLETFSSIDENVVVQADVQLLGKTIESLVTEFDQEKFEKFLSLGFASPKAMRHYHKVSSETRSRISSEITPRGARATAHSASGVTSNEVLKTSHAARATRVNIPQGTRMANALAHDQSDSEDQSRHCSPLRTLQFKVAESSQQPLRLNQNAEH